MGKAVELASRNAEEGDTVLLSPGAASFGLFKNEFDRGDQFREQVQALSSE
jgi:UDP-N-acetylmuramoylalanine--D-glutamate ligase